jgi:hypothetical protein
MSQLRLLSTGRCLVDLQDSASRYRISNPRALPKFGSKKNPFRATARPEPMRVQPEAVANGGQLGVERGNPAPVRPPQPQPAASNVRPNLSPAASKAGGLGHGVRGWLGTWAAKIRGWFTRPPKPAKPAIAPFAKPTTQGELSLDTVKVMRNDLSDTDLEVKPVQAARTHGSAVPEQAKLELPQPAGGGL